mmetsp:Transcript_31612/g.100361  ORF Transcript_31612/g.100361 Transcript_31612/m.100361 type:complete len:236 (+) Transcript_31612:434-1141(+)
MFRRRGVRNLDLARCADAGVRQRRCGSDVIEQRRPPAGVAGEVKGALRADDPMRQIGGEAHARGGPKHALGHHRRAQRTHAVRLVGDGNASIQRHRSLEEIHRLVFAPPVNAPVHVGDVCAEVFLRVQQQRLQRHEVVFHRARRNGVAAGVHLSHVLETGHVEGVAPCLLALLRAIVRNSEGGPHAADHPRRRLHSGIVGGGEVLEELRPLVDVPEGLDAPERAHELHPCGRSGA